MVTGDVSVESGVVLDFDALTGISGPGTTRLESGAVANFADSSATGAIVNELGGLVVLGSLLVPLLLGDAGLQHRHGELDVALLSLKWHSALVFELGVVMIVVGVVIVARYTPHGHGPKKPEAAAAAPAPAPAPDAPEAAKEDGSSS